MSRFDTGLRVKLFGRLLLLQSTWSFERMQGLGFAWALEPWLERLYPDAAARRAALERHAEYFNTQPYAASMVLGLVCGLEESAAALPEAERAAAFARIAAVKKAMGASLAGLGDSFFWASLRPAAAAAGVLTATCAVALGRPDAGLWGAAAFLLAYNLPALLIRWRGLSLGYEWGEKTPAKLKDLDVQGWVGRVRLAGTAAAAALAVITAAFSNSGGAAAGAACVLGAMALYRLLPARVSAVRLYAAACVAGAAAAAAGWL